MRRNRFYPPRYNGRHVVLVPPGSAREKTATDLRSLLITFCRGRSTLCHRGAGRKIDGALFSFQINCLSRFLRPAVYVLGYSVLRVRLFFASYIPASLCCIHYLRVLEILNSTFAKVLARLTLGRPAPPLCFASAKFFPLVIYVTVFPADKLEILPIR